MTARKRVGVLISGRGSNLGALVAAANAPDYPARIALALSDAPDAEGLALARGAGVPTACVRRDAFARGAKGRAAFEAEIDRALDAAGVEIVCLAGFMRVLTGAFVRRWTGRMLNIHPSLLPAFRGLDVHERAIAGGVRIAGCTVHFVSEGIDEGPILGQAATAVSPEDDAATLAARVLALEHRLYPACLALLAGGDAALGADGRVVFAPGRAPAGDGALFSPPVAAGGDARART